MRKLKNNPFWSHGVISGSAKVKKLSVEGKTLSLRKIGLII